MTGMSQVFQILEARMRYVFWRIPEILRCKLSCLVDNSFILAEHRTSTGNIGEVHRFFQFGTSIIPLRLFNRYPMHIKIV